MKNLKKTIIFSAILLTVNCILPNEIFAQGPGFPDPPVDTPFDGGVTLIVAAAAGYSIKKLHDRNKNK